MPTLEISSTLTVLLELLKLDWLTHQRKDIIMNTINDFIDGLGEAQKTFDVYNSTNGTEPDNEDSNVYG